MDKKMLGWGIVAVAAILATLFFGVNYPVPPAPTPAPEIDVLGEFESRSLSRPVQLRDVRILQDLAVGGDATVTGDVSVGDDLTVTDDITAGGDVTITGGLEVTGGVTGTNVLTSGNQTIAGIKTFSTPAAFTGGVTGPIVVTGPTAAATATPAVVMNNTGAANTSLRVETQATPWFEVYNNGAARLYSTLKVDGASDLIGNIADSGGVLTVADNMIIDGQADAIQLTVQGHSTQNTSLLVLETSDGTDVLTASNAGNVDVAGTLQYGANNLYPVGYATSGQQLVYGTAAVTGTLVLPHGLTTVTFCSAVLGEDPKTGVGEAAFVTVAVAANACTAKVWQDDWTTASVETNVVVQWLVIGAP